MYTGPASSSCSSRSGSRGLKYVADDLASSTHTTYTTPTPITSAPITFIAGSPSPTPVNSYPKTEADGTWTSDSVPSRVFLNSHILSTSYTDSNPPEDEAKRNKVVLKLLHKLSGQNEDLTKVIKNALRQPIPECGVTIPVPTPHVAEGEAIYNRCKHLVESQRELHRQVQALVSAFHTGAIEVQVQSRPGSPRGLESETGSISHQTPKSPAGKVAETVVEKLVEVPVEKIVKVEVPVEKIVERLIPVDKIVEKVVTVEKIVERLIREGESTAEDKGPATVENMVERVVEVPVEKIVERVVEVPVEKIVTVEVPVPTTIEKIVKKVVTVEKIVDRLIRDGGSTAEDIVERVVEVPVEKIVERVVEVPVEKVVTVEVPVPTTIEKIVEKQVEVPVQTTIERIVEKHVEVPVEKIVERLVPVDKIVEKLVTVEKVVERVIREDSGSPTSPQTIVQTVEVERIVEVPKLVEVEVPKILETIKTVEIERIVEVPKIVETTKVVTIPAIPVPVEKVAGPNVDTLKVDALRKSEDFQNDILRRDTIKVLKPPCTAEVGIQARELVDSSTQVRSMEFCFRCKMETPPNYSSTQATFTQGGATYTIGHGNSISFDRASPELLNSEDMNASMAIASPALTGGFDGHFNQSMQVEPAYGGRYGAPSNLSGSIQYYNPEEPVTKFVGIMGNRSRAYTGESIISAYGVRSRSTSNTANSRENRGRVPESSQLLKKRQNSSSKIKKSNPKFEAELSGMGTTRVDSDRDDSEDSSEDNDEDFHSLAKSYRKLPVPVRHGSWVPYEVSQVSSDVDSESHYSLRSPESNLSSTNLLMLQRDDSSPPRSPRRRPSGDHLSVDTETTPASSPTASYASDTQLKIDDDLKFDLEAPFTESFVVEGDQPTMARETDGQATLTIGGGADRLASGGIPASDPRGTGGSSHFHGGPGDSIKNTNVSPLDLRMDVECKKILLNVMEHNLPQPAEREHTLRMEPSFTLPSEFQVKRYNPSSSKRLVIRHQMWRLHMGQKSMMCWDLDKTPGNGSMDSDPGKMDGMASDGATNQVFSITSLISAEKEPKNARELIVTLKNPVQVFGLRFPIAIQREQFYQMLCIMKSKLRLWCPSLCIPNTVDCMTTVETKPAPWMEDVDVVQFKTAVSNTQKEELSLWVGTCSLLGFNQTSQVGRNLLNSWVPHGEFNIYVIATHDMPNPSSSEDWSRSLREYFGHQYSLIVRSTIWDSCLCVFSGASHKISNIEFERFASVGQMVGQQGACVATLKYLETSLCFIACHLPAGRWECDRDNLVHEIARHRITAGKAPLCTFDHVFVLGDTGTQIDSGTPRSLAGSGHWSLGFSSSAVGKEINPDVESRNLAPACRMQESDRIKWSSLPTLADNVKAIDAQSVAVSSFGGPSLAYGLVTIQCANPYISLFDTMSDLSFKMEDLETQIKGYEGIDQTLIISGACLQEKYCLYFAWGHGYLTQTIDPIIPSLEYLETQHLQLYVVVQDKIVATGVLALQEVLQLHPGRFEVEMGFNGYICGVVSGVFKLQGHAEDSTFSTPLLSITRDATMEGKGNMAIQKNPFPLEADAFSESPSLEPEILRLSDLGVSINEVC